MTLEIVMLPPPKPPEKVTRAPDCSWNVEIVDPWENEH